MGRRRGGKGFGGLVLIAAGILFLLHQLDMFTFDIGYLFSTFWPVFIIVFALSGLLFQSKRGGSGGTCLWNFFTLLLGVYFLLVNLKVDGFTYGNLYKFIVPAVLIAAGISMFFKKPYAKSPGDGGYRYDDDYKTSDYGKYDTGKTESGTPESGTPEYVKNDNPGTSGYRGSPYNGSYSRDTVHRSAFIGDTHLGHDYWELTPLNISHFVGDTVIDLTKASIPYGETRVQVSAFIGDVQVLVPNDVQLGIEVTSSCFIGDARVLERQEGGMFTNVKIQSPNYFEAEKKIRLTASSFIGDVAVTRVG
jgi:lia operon protein LiaF